MIPTAERILAYWSEGQLKRWPQETTRSRRLSAETCDYLTNVGLPCLNDWFLEIDERVTDLPHHERNPNLVMVGHDGVVPICIDRANGESVVVVEGPGKYRFANSSVRQFGACFYFFRKDTFGRPEDGTKDHEACQRLYTDILEADPAAVEKPGLYWTSILAQVEHGDL